MGIMVYSLLLRGKAGFISSTVGVTTPPSKSSSGGLGGLSGLGLIRFELGV